MSMSVSPVGAIRGNTSPSFSFNPGRAVQSIAKSGEEVSLEARKAATKKIMTWTTLTGLAMFALYFGFSALGKKRAPVW